MSVNALANDKYRATLRATYIDGVDTTLSVTAIPSNVPTNVTVGWNTDYETHFRVEGVSGTNSSNYTLTGITKLRGYTGNLPENLAVNCLNIEEFFNQYSNQLPSIDEDDMASNSDQAVPTQQSVKAYVDSGTMTLTNKRLQKRVVTVTQHATPTYNTDNGDIFYISGLAQAITSMTTNLSGTPVVDEMIEFEFVDNGTARAITWGASFAATTTALPTTTVVSTLLRVLFQRNKANTVWDCVAVA